MITAGFPPFASFDSEFGLVNAARDVNIKKVSKRTFVLYLNPMVNMSRMYNSNLRESTLFVDDSKWPRGTLHRKLVFGNIHCVPVSRKLNCTAAVILLLDVGHQTLLDPLLDIRGPKTIQPVS